MSALAGQTHSASPCGRRILVRLATMKKANRRFSCEGTYGCHFQGQLQIMQREKLPEAMIGKHKRATGSSSPQSEGKERRQKGQDSGKLEERTFFQNVLLQGIDRFTVNLRAPS